MLLTNLEMRRDRKTLWWAVSAYFTRWRIVPEARLRHDEEAIRFYPSRATTSRTSV